MKKITNLIKTFALICLLSSFSKLNAQNCVANFTWTTWPNGVVTFTSTSILTNSAGTTFYWTFGNGTTYSATGGAGFNTSTTYTANGTYVVSLFIWAIPTCSAGVQYTITINNVTGGACNLNANFNYTQGANGLVNFNNTSTGTIGGTSYNWAFGDGGTSTSTSPAHTYSANGTYIATLTAVNNLTCTSTKTLAINVNSYCVLSANYSFTAGANGLVSFQSTSTGTNVGYIHKWQFGDGGQTVGGPTTSHTYVNGIFNCTLTVMNNSVSPTCIDTIVKVITVTSNTCNIGANFTSTVNAGGLVGFNSTSTGTNGSTTYTWNFGNGFTSNSANPSLTYASGGIYVVTLIARNAANCISTITKTVNVNTIPCVANANFTLIPTFTAQYWVAIPAYPWNVSNASWNWGDGSPATFSLYASHMYSVSGMYTICLTVTASCGATATACSSYSVFRPSQGIIYVNCEAPPLENIDNDNVGIGQINNKSFNYQVVPNPNNGAFSVNMFGLEAPVSYISVYNLIGEKLYSSEIDSAGGTLNKNIEMPSAANGIYLIKIENGDKSYTKKIVINK